MSTQQKVSVVFHSLSDALPGLSQDDLQQAARRIVEIVEKHARAVRS